MSTYCVTFRIANRDVSGASYDERRNRLIENLRDSKQMGFWDGTTSFFFVESHLNTTNFAANAIRGLSAQFDMVVIFDPEDMSGAYFGAVPDVDVLESFLPLAKKLP